MKLDKVLYDAQMANTLKSKEPRLRDWNKVQYLRSTVDRHTWNQKNLDYEIETLKSSISLWRWCILKSKEPRLRDWNDTTATGSLFSYHLKSKEPRLRDWNKCSLTHFKSDAWTLEIKRTSITRLKLTRIFDDANMFPKVLEIKRTSITRLKPYRGNSFYSALTLKSKEPRLRDWNLTVGVVLRVSVRPWNQKNLDYEIETISQDW